MKNKTPSIVVVAVLTTVTVMSWIFFEVYRVLNSTPGVNIPKEILEPFSSDINTQMIDDLQNKYYFGDDYLIENSYEIATPSPSISSISIHKSPLNIEVNTDHLDKLYYVSLHTGKYFLSSPFRNSVICQQEDIKNA